MTSALHDGDGKTAAGRLLVLVEHVCTGGAHRFDRGVQGHEVLPVAPNRYACGGDRLDRGDAVALDAGNLDKASHRIAGQTEVVLDTDLGGVLDLLGRAVEHGRESGRCHRTRRADLTLATDLGARNRRITFDQ